MAGDWIKMRVSLSKSPQVIRLAGDLGLSKNEIIGGLFLLWVLADEHSINGEIKLGAKHLDLEIGIQGFAQALINVGWLSIVEDHKVVLTNYQEHNGKSGKKRAQDYTRARELRLKEKAKLKEKHKTTDNSATTCDETATDGVKDATDSNQLPTRVRVRVEKELEVEQEKEKEVEIETKVETNGSVVNAIVWTELASDLAREWHFRRKGVCASEQLPKVLEHFEEALKHGLDYKKAMAEIKRASRNKSEFLWQYIARMNPQLSIKKQTSVEDALKNMMDNKSNILGVAFNDQ